MVCDMGMAISDAGIGGRTSTGESIYTSGNDQGHGDGESEYYLESQGQSHPYFMGLKSQTLRLHCFTQESSSWFQVR